jgi:hypothetical protein
MERLIFPAGAEIRELLRARSKHLGDAVEHLAAVYAVALAQPGRAAGCAHRVARVLARAERDVLSFCFIGGRTAARNAADEELVRLLDGQAVTRRTSGTARSLRSPALAAEPTPL